MEADDVLNEYLQGQSERLCGWSVGRAKGRSSEYSAPNRHALPNIVSATKFEATQSIATKKSQFYRGGRECQY